MVIAVDKRVLVDKLGHLRRPRQVLSRLAEPRRQLGRQHYQRIAPRIADGVGVGLFAPIGQRPLQHRASETVGEYVCTPAVTILGADGCQLSCSIISRSRQCSAVPAPAHYSPLSIRGVGAGQFLTRRMPGERLAAECGRGREFGGRAFGIGHDGISLCVAEVLHGRGCQRHIAAQRVGKGRVALRRGQCQRKRKPLPDRTSQCVISHHRGHILAAVPGSLGNLRHRLAEAVEPARGH